MQIDRHRPDLGIRGLRPLLWIGTTGALLAAAVSAAFSLRVAVALIALGLAGLTAAMWLAGRAQAARLEQLARASSELQQTVKARDGQRKRQLAELTRQSQAAQAGLERRMGRLTATADRTEARIIDHFKRLSARVDRANTAAEQAPGMAMEIVRLASRVDPTDAPLPAPGGWAATTSTLIALVDEFLTRPALQNVVECGSGTSTIWMALAAARRQSGHVTALEHDPVYAEQTREQLRRHGVSDFATVVDAPLSTVVVDGREFPWYDQAALDRLPAQVDLLFVDGPPGASGPDARLPAYPLLAPRMPVGSVVVLDDIDRAEEQAIAERWCQLESPTGRLVSRSLTDRAQILDVVATERASATDAGE